jgi:hypothetical protein
MNLGSFIRLGMMRELIHGIQPSPVVFDQIRTSSGYRLFLSLCLLFITLLVNLHNTTIGYSLSLEKLTHKLSYMRFLLPCITIQGDISHFYPHLCVSAITRTCGYICIS